MVGGFTPSFSLALRKSSKASSKVVLLSLKFNGSSYIKFTISGSAPFSLIKLVPTSAAK